MSQYDPKKIEEYQLILLKNPRSPVFAALAETYRKMGLLEEALEVTHKGIKHNPEFVSGLVAHAKILFELKDYRQAIKVLTKANLLKPENILALRLLGHSYIKLRKHAKALYCFKKLMILSPNDETAIAFIQKWEFLEHLPQENASTNLELDDVDSWVKKLPSAEQALHLVDSFMNSGDRESAYEIVNSARLAWPESKGLEQRQDLLVSSEDPKEQPNQQLLEIEIKKEFYQNLLQRIRYFNSVDPETQP